LAFETRSPACALRLRWLFTCHLSQPALTLCVGFCRTTALCLWHSSCFSFVLPSAPVCASRSALACLTSFSACASPSALAHATPSSPASALHSMLA
jgi:hypothetical protein